MQSFSFIFQNNRKTARRLSIRVIQDLPVNSTVEVSGPMEGGMGRGGGVGGAGFKNC